MVSSFVYFALVSKLELVHFFEIFAAPCRPGGSFFGFPTWYKYLEGNGTGQGCVPELTGINDIWLIILAIIELLIRIAAVAAIIYVVFGGFRFITARGNSEKITIARNTVQDALVGLIIAIVAIAMVNFIGRQL